MSTTKLIRELSWTEKELPQKSGTKHVHVHIFMSILDRAFFIDPINFKSNKLNSWINEIQCNGKGEKII